MPRLDQMGQEDTAALIDFLVRDAAAMAGFYPPTYDNHDKEYAGDFDDFDDYDDDFDEDDYNDSDDIDESFLDVRIEAAMHETGIICFRIIGLAHAKEKQIQNYRLETFPGSNEGLEAVTYDALTQRRGKDVTTGNDKKEELFSRKAIEKLQNFIESLGGMETVKKAAELNEMVERNASVSISYLLQADSLKSVKAIIDQLPDESITESELYKLSKKYYLRFVLREPAKNFRKRLFIIEEHGKLVKDRQHERLAFIKEHGATIIKKDVKKALSL